MAAKRNSTPIWACEDVQPHQPVQKDVKRADKRGKDMAQLKAVLELLINGGPLPPEYKDHPLRGNFAGSRDCHIEPDWVLIYTLAENGSHIRFERTGTHSDLFR